MHPSESSFAPATALRTPWRIRNAAAVVSSAPSVHTFSSADSASGAPLWLLQAAGGTQLDADSGPRSFLASASVATRRWRASDATKSKVLETVRRVLPDEHRVNFVDRMSDDDTPREYLRVEVFRAGLGISRLLDIEEEIADLLSSALATDSDRIVVVCRTA